MELLAKMSEAYMKEKAEKTEVAARGATLEAENKTLKNQLTEARRRELEEKERSQEVSDRFYLLTYTQAPLLRFQCGRHKWKPPNGVSQGHALMTSALYCGGRGSKMP